MMKGTCPVSVLLAGWLCVLLAAVTADSDVETLYKKVGDDVVLKPTPTSEQITAIQWMHGNNMAALWLGAGTVANLPGVFEEHGRLNTSSGELTITGLKRDHTGLYTVEINNKKAGATRVIVLSPVPKPYVNKTCETGGNGCYLICEGDTAGAEPVTYKWNFGPTVKATHALKEDTSSFTEFICELRNEISHASSPPDHNPMYNTFQVPEVEPGANMNVVKGVIVFSCLLSAVLLLLLVHRIRAGMWFFQKESMPWEADFWRKQERPPRPAAESNGAASPRTDEETPMT